MEKFEATGGPVLGGNNWSAHLFQLNTATIGIGSISTRGEGNEVLLVGSF